MLKFISISNDTNYEDGLLQELNIGKDSNSVVDYLASTSSADLISAIKQIAEKNEIKDSKVQDFIKSRVFLLVSLLCGKRQFLNTSDLNNKIFNSVVDLLQLTSQDQENKYFLFNNLEEFYYILPAASDYKSEILGLIWKLFTESEDKLKMFSSLQRRISELLVNLIKTGDDQDVIKALSGAGQVADKLKNYSLFYNEENIETLITDKIRSLITSDSVTHDIAKIHFYIHFFNLSSFNFKTDLSKVRGVYEKFGLTTEAKVVDAVLGNNLKGVYHAEHFEVSYGVGTGDVIVKNAKLRVIYNILLANSKSNIASFSDITNLFHVTVEDLEEVMFDAEHLQLFKLIIDYEQGLVRVRYIRKFNYTKENLEEMKSKTSALRERLARFAKKIDLLLISE